MKEVRYYTVELKYVTEFMGQLFRRSTPECNVRAHDSDENKVVFRYFMGSHENNMMIGFFEQVIIKK